MAMPQSRYKGDIQDSGMGSGSAQQTVVTECPLRVVVSWPELEFGR